MTDHLTDDEREANPQAARCDCGHRAKWHHDQRGCEFHGVGPRRCPCALTSDEAVARIISARLAAQRDGIANAIERELPDPNQIGYVATRRAARIAREYEQKENDQ